MGFNAGFQLSLELTRVFGAASNAVSGAKNLINFARELRKSGSDILVEQDLADVFGRGKIVPDVEAQFKKDVVANIKIAPLHADCEIHLQSGPGPTVERALRDRDRRYLSTVVQLSMLASSFDTEALAYSLVECMGRRVEVNVPGAAAQPDFASVFGTLQACASQTSSFNWGRFFGVVRARIRSHFPQIILCNEWSRGMIQERTSSTILLAAMDYLYLIQSLPEDRKMVFKAPEFMVPIVVWAHYVLGLIVSIQHPGDRPLYFGTGRAQVVVQFNERLWKQNLDDYDVFLMDRNEEIVLTTPINTHRGIQIDSEERYFLQGLGTEHLRRQFNTFTATPDGDALFQQTTQFIVALAIVHSRTLCRGTGQARQGSGEKGDLARCYSLDLWRIFDASDVIFDGTPYDKKEVSIYVSMCQAHYPQHVQLLDILYVFMDTCAGKFSKPFTTEELKKNYGIRESLENCVITLASLVLVFSHVIEIRDCAELPLIFNLSPEKSFRNIIGRGSECGPSSLPENALFEQIALWMLGSSQRMIKADQSVLISSFGWSVFLSNLQDDDPAVSVPALVHVQRGVPTSTKTKEQKLKISDRELLDIYEPFKWLHVEDQGESYVPRCVGSITARREYCITLVNKFQLNIDYEIVNEYGISLTYSTGYRVLHRSLWQTYVTKACCHPSTNLQTARLGPSAVAISGFVSESDDRSFLERRCPSTKVWIQLVKGDHRARWLAVFKAASSKDRRAMLRSEECCEDCALDTVKELPGKWILII